MALTRGQASFVQHLRAETGLNSRVLSAWVMAEEGGANSPAAQQRERSGNHNWLNIGYFDSGPGAITKDKAFASPQSAARATAEFLKGQKFGASSGIRKILNSTGQSQENQIAAIAKSGWASSGYNNGNNLRQLLGHAPAPGAAPSVRSSAPSAPSPTLSPQLDTAGLQKAQGMALLAGMFEKRGRGAALLKTGLLSDAQPDPANFMKTVSQKAAPSRPSSIAPLPSAAIPKGGHYKIANFEGHRVADWMVPALRYARSKGWKGQINSGVRTRAEQAALYQTYVNSGFSNAHIAAKPGQSNHEIGNGGAIDVSDPAGLHQVLLHFTGKRPIWAPTVGLKDNVHFSSTGR